MLKIWGRLNSINVQKVVWTAVELGIPFRRMDAGMQHGVVDTPDYLAKNPNGQIPCIEDEWFVLWESNAIVRYLAAKHAARHQSLYPAEANERALADQWMDWQQTALNPAMGPAFVGIVRTHPGKRDQAAIDASIAAFETKLAILDAHLANSAYLLGEAFTMADIVVGVTAHRWFNIAAKRQPRPAVERWYAKISARPASAQALMRPVT
jgi:glutathione S-transferase